MTNCGYTLRQIKDFSEEGILEEKLDELKISYDCATCNFEERCRDINIADVGEISPDET